MLSITLWLVLRDDELEITAQIRQRTKSAPSSVSAGTAGALNANC